jgi:3-mercaptopyruvate sulfurtransferase SseA
MPEDFDKGHAPGARNVPYHLSVTPQGQLQFQTELKINNFLFI